MSYSSLPPEIRRIAQTHLTPKQHHVLKLHLAGLGQRRIATMLNIHRTTARDHLITAHHTLETHGIHRDQNGHYYQKEAA